MSNAVIFKDLPATFPEKDRYQKPSLVSSMVFHALLITIALVLPLMFPQHIEPWVTLLVATLPPPPAPPPPIEAPPAPAERPAPKVITTVQVDPGAIIAPATIPRDIAIVVEDPVPAANGVGGGVTGGVPGGVLGGVLGGLLASTAKPAEAMPPPPPPPPMPVSLHKDPIRVGGMVQEPKPVKLVPP